MTIKEYEKLKNIANNICKKKDLANDLLHDALEAGLKYPNEKLEFIKKDGKLFFFFARIMANMYHSKTSRFYYKYKKIYEHIYFTDGNNNDTFISTLYNDGLDIQRLELIDRILDGIYWYDRELFKLYYFGEVDGKRYSLSSLAKRTGISRKSIFNTVNNVRELIKKELNENK